MIVVGYNFRRRTLNYPPCLADVGLAWDVCRASRSALRKLRDPLLTATKTNVEREPQHHHKAMLIRLPNNIVWPLIHVEYSQSIQTDPVASSRGSLYCELTSAGVFPSTRTTVQVDMWIKPLNGRAYTANTLHPIYACRLIAITKMTIVTVTTPSSSGRKRVRVSPIFQYFFSPLAVRPPVRTVLLRSATNAHCIGVVLQ